MHDLRYRSSTSNPHSLQFQLLNTQISCLLFTDFLSISHWFCLPLALFIYLVDFGHFHFFYLKASAKAGVIMNYVSQHQQWAGAEGSEGLRPVLALGMKTGTLPVYDIMHRWGADGLNLRQTQS